MASDMAIAFVERYTGLALSPRAFTDVREAVGERAVTLYHGPVVADSTLTVTAVSDDEDVDVLTTDEDAGVVYFDDPLTPGVLYKFEYQAGYATVPDGLAEILERIDSDATAYAAQTSSDSTRLLKSETRDQYTYTKFDDANKFLSDATRVALDPWVRY